MQQSKICIRRVFQPQPGRPDGAFFISMVGYYKHASPTELALAWAELHNRVGIEDTGNGSSFDLRGFPCQAASQGGFANSSRGLVFARGLLLRCPEDGQAEAKHEQAEGHAHDAKIPGAILVGGCPIDDITQTPG